MPTKTGVLETQKFTEPATLVDIYQFTIRECVCPIRCTIGLSNHYRFEYWIYSKDGELICKYKSSLPKDLDWKSRIKNDNN